VLWTGEKASLGTGLYRPIFRNPDPAILNRTYSSDRIVGPPFPPPPEDALGGGQLKHNLGLDLRLHHLLKAIIDRHEHERKPTETL
jgi:hypothetical protein